MAVVRTASRIQLVGLLVGRDRRRCVRDHAFATAVRRADEQPRRTARRPDRDGVGRDLGHDPRRLPGLPSAVPSEESASGPVSANLVVDGVDPRPSPPGPTRR